jgi:hypothetical protein
MKDRIEELEAELDRAQTHVFNLLNQAGRYAAQLERVKPIAQYADTQANNAQIRLLREDKELYNDTYWQPVLDTIRFGLQQALKDEQI